MRTSFFAVAALGALASTVAAEPTRMHQAVKRQAATGPSDVEILNYALTLEHLENAFYKEGLEKFSAADFTAAGFPTRIRRRFVQISEQEKSHVSFLVGALGASAVGSCQYAFGLDSVDTFLAVSRILEGVGTAAYLGAAPDIDDAGYLAAAGSILTIEARHTSFLSETVGASGFPVAYDAALNYNQVFSLAAPFIIPGTCGTSGTLPAGIKAFPKLNVKSTVNRAGGNIALNFKLNGQATPYYAVYINGLDKISVEIGANGVSRIPRSLSGSGATYVLINTVAGDLTDATTLAGPAVLFL